MRCPVRSASTPREVLEKTAQNLPLYDHNDPSRRVLERDLEVQNGGTGVSDNIGKLV